MKRGIGNSTLFQVIAALILLLTFCPATSYALIYDYQYTGNPFRITWAKDSSSTPGFTQFDAVTIEMQTAQPLSAATLYNGTPNIPYTLTMYAGTLALSLAPGTDGFLKCTIDRLTGLPNQWYANLSQEVSGVFTTIHSENITDHQLGSDFDVMAWDWAAVSNMPGNPGFDGDVYGSTMNNTGAWTMTVIDGQFIPVPEPSTLYMLGAGCVLLTILAALRKMRSIMESRA